jgi:hypothetical protein
MTAMSSTLFEAPQFDAARDRRKKTILSIILVVVVVVGACAWFLRFWPEERAVDHFFHALQQKDYEKAYGIWLHDAEWKQHPQQYASYPYSDFYNDWGPSGEWGIINQYHVDTAATPKSGSSGVVVQVTVNGRTKKCFVWVEKKTKTLTFSPFELQQT